MKRAGAASGSAGYPELQFADSAGWREWLEKNHSTMRGVWLRLAKKAAPVESISYLEAVEEALCYGWIDGQARRLDEHFWLQKLTPRGGRSAWSRINRERVEALQAAGRMSEGGLRAVAAARADGRWDRAYDSPASATVPEDLQTALDASPAAAAFFATLSGARRYAFLYRIQTAVKPETRARRITEFVAMLDRGETLRS